jgi:hypothetical protein
MSLIYHLNDIWLDDVKPYSRSHAERLLEAAGKENGALILSSLEVVAWSQHSVVGIATGYGLDDRGVEFESR